MLANRLGVRVEQLYQSSCVLLAHGGVVVIP